MNDRIRDPRSTPGRPLEGFPRNPYRRATAATASFVALALVALVASGCFRSKQEIRQLDDGGYLVFLGKTSGCEAVVSAEGREVLRLDTLRDGVKVPIESGTYVVTVRRDGEPVVERRVFLDHRSTFEIRVP